MRFWIYSQYCTLIIEYKTVFLTKFREYIAHVWCMTTITDNFSTMKLNDIDKKILGYLQNDAKITNKELSAKLDLSVTAIYERVKKMERSGVIAQYITLINKDIVGLGFQVFCHVKLDKHEKGAITSFEEEVKAIDEVLECFNVSGDYDYLLKVVVRDMEHFRSFMITKLTALKYIRSTQSSFTMSEVKNTTIISI